MPRVLERQGEMMGGAGEESGEDLRETYEERGEKVLESDQQKREQESLKKLEELKKREAEIAARLAEIDRLLGDKASERVIERPMELTVGTTRETVGGGETVPIGETETVSAEVRRVVDKAKKNTRMKKFLGGVAMVALAMLMQVQGFAMSRGNKGASKADVPGTVTQYGTTEFQDLKSPSISEFDEAGFEPAESFEDEVDEVVENGATAGEVVDDETKDKEINYNLYGGYNQKGMWMSEGKTWEYNFANASEVGEVCQNNPIDMIKYAASNQMETSADYYANLPEQLQLKGAKGISILESEAMGEKLNLEQRGKFAEWFNGVIDKAQTRFVTLNGKYQNAYMELEDKDGPVSIKNMKLKKFNTVEKNREVLQLYWVDDNGDEIGSMTIKMTPIRGAEGNIIGWEGCMQVVNKIDEKPEVYKEMDDLVPSAPEVVTTTEDTTTEEETTTEETTTEDENKIPEETTTEDENKVPEETTTEDENKTPEENKEEDDNKKPEQEPEGDPTPVPTPTPAPAPASTPIPTPDPTPPPVIEVVESKDRENLERIDKNINEDIAEDVGTERIEITPTDEVSEEDKTEKPDASYYEGTAPTIVQNEPSQEAAPIQIAAEGEENEVNVISAENDYTEDLGGANQDEYAPVEENQEAQEVADTAATPVSEAPISDAEIDDILGDMGIF